MTTKGTAYVDGKPVGINIPNGYGKPKRRKAAPFNPSPAAILQAAIAAAKDPRCPRCGGSDVADDLCWDCGPA